MRFYTVLASRPQYYDRNPLDAFKAYGATIGPAGDTARWTYTVPTARKAFVEMAQAVAVRVTAAGAVGEVDAYIAITPSGGSATNMLEPGAIWTNNVGDSTKAFVGSVGLLQAGDAIKGRTADVSTTGTVEYQVNAKISEFDA